MTKLELVFSSKNREILKRVELNTYTRFDANTFSYDKSPDLNILYIRGTVINNEFRTETKIETNQYEIVITYEV